MKKIILCAFAAITASILPSCQKEFTPSSKSMQEITLDLGFEDVNDAKTFLVNGNVAWGSNEHVQVFTDKNEVFDFASQSQAKSLTASFTGSIPEGDKIKYILSISKTTADNLAIDSDGNISGSDLALTTSQNQSNPHTYKNNAACSIMKDGDTKLRNVLGLVQMDFPAYDSGQSKIYKVVISADQYIAGRYSLNYTGTDPVASGIIENSIAKKEITVTTRYATDKYESGILYALMVPGTYTGFKMTVYPFASEPSGKDSYTLGEPFEIAALSDVVISRGKWIDAGTIPATKPVTKTKCNTPSGLSATVKGTEVTFNWTKAVDADEYVLEVYSGTTLALNTTLNPAELPYVVDDVFAESTEYSYKVKATSSSLDDSDWAEGSFTTGTAEDDGYPNDTDALDYGLTGPWTSTFSSALFEMESNAKFPEGGKVVDKVEYGWDATFSGDKIKLDQCYNFDKTTYSVNIPLKRYIKFKINRPGTFSWVPYTSNKPTMVVALITKKSGATSASYVFENASPTSYPNKKDESYRQSVEITAAMLSGIDEAATVYLFCSAGSGFTTYPFSWTPTPLTKSSLSSGAQDYNEGWRL